MSDEESFVILDSSPKPSLRSHFDSSAIQPYSGHYNESNKLVAGKNSETLNTENTSLKSKENAQQEIMMMTSASEPVSKNMISSVVDRNAQTETSMASSLKSNNSAQRSLAGNGIDNSLAASFIMGEVSADVLKTNVFSQFPSLCSMEACAEDAIKLQNFMSEYLELKNTLAKVNDTMKQFYKKTQQWKDDMHRVEQDYKKQLGECQLQIASLRNENLDLKRDIIGKVEQINISENLRKRDHEALLQDISEKTAQINNMAAQIQKLEEQQLASFEFLPKNLKDSKDKPEYVDRLEHETTVKNLERQMSVLLAENLDLKDVQKQYIDEITCLKVNLTAAEELLNQARADINLLKAKDMEKSELFTSYETERDGMKEEMALLRQQVEVYSKDFEMERMARQNIAGEKDQLLQDLRALQRKNQELIEQSQKYWASVEERASKNKSPSPASTHSANMSNTVFEANSHQRPIRPLPKPSTSSAKTSAPSAENQYCCPLCNKGFKAVHMLQTHVEQCLEDN